jgi:radical SAM-linked protein
LERAVRRAGVPIAFSAGFTPHPRISYVGAAPTGAASEAEYLEIAVAERCSPELVREALDASLPDGLDVLEVVEARTPGFADRFETSLWRIELPGVSADAAARAVAEFVAAEAIEVSRLTKNGVRRFDARAAVLSLDCAWRERADAVGERGCAILTAVVRHTTPAVRPDDILTALREASGLTPPQPPLVVRLAQGPMDAETGRPADPLAPDREAVVDA